MVQRYSDVFSGLFLLIVSVIMFFTTYSFKALTISKIGPDFMPKIIAVFIAVISVTISVSAYKKIRNSKKLPPPAMIEEDAATLESELVEEKSYSSVLLSVALMAGYLILMPYLGFLIMTSIYLFLQMIVLSGKTNRRLVVFIIVSIVSSAITYYIFRSIFYVMLPPGILG